MAELGQQTVKFSTLVSRAAEESFQSLKELVAKSKSSDLSDTEKKIGLLKYIVKTQQRMLRLNVLAKWCQQVPLIQYCQQLASTLSSHDTCFTQTADSLFFMHEGLQQARAPIYDVPSAIEVLLTGTYERLPKCVEDIGTQSSLSESQQMPALKKLDTLVRSKLLEISIPKEISMVKIKNGTALLHVDGEFEVLVTLGYRGHLSLWRILHLDLLVGERNGPVKLEELRRLALGDELERRMAAAENPFMILYSVLHEFCVALIMDTVIRQILALRQGRWKDAIRFELISDGSSGQGNAGAGLITHDGELESTGQRTPGAKLSYWLDLEKNSSSSDSGSSPFLKIEPGSDLQIKCVHSSFVIDPSTGKEAEFVLDRSCIDVEKLLLKAICGNRYTRLLEIHKDLMKSGHIYRAPGDVSLQHCMTEVDFDHEKKQGMFHGEESEGQKVLGVRAYGSSFFILGINLRNGRFLLQTSRNILSPSVLVDAAEALNQGSISAAEVFATLRSKSILHLFAYIGKFLGLQVYEQGFAAEKVPKELLNGSNFLLMGCRDESSSYFILMQPNKDFKPLFKLIETRSQFSKSSVLDIVRMKDINIDHLQIMKDELSSSIVDWGKAVKDLAGAGLPGESLEHDLLSNFNLEALVHKTGCAPSSFASVVDEVFGHDEGTPVTYCGSGISSSFTELHALETTTIDAKPQRVSDGLSPSKGRGIIQHTSSIGCDYNGSLYQGSNPKGLNQLYAADRQTSTGEKLHQSKSDQDLASLRSPLTVEAGSLRSRDEDHLTLLNGSSREASTSGRSTHTLSDMLPGGAHSSSLSGKINGLGSSPIRPLGPSINYLMSNSVASNPVSHTEDCAIGHNTQPCRNSRKRRVSDVLNMLPSLLGMDVEPNINKRRKTMSDITPSSLTYTSLDRVCQPRRYSYGRLISEANRGNAPSTAYIAVLLHVVRHCSLCVKHARLTSQMEILHIEYNEEASVGDAFPNIWLRLPSLGSAFSWPNVVLRLGRSGTLCWDVKIKDQHFKDLWELQKGNNTTPWGGGIRIANTSDIDSHIYYDSEGVVLCYKSVEDDSIKNVVADIRRLSNARMFALGMRKLLGVKMEEKVDEGLNNDNKAIIGAKSPIDSVERLSEQMRKAFKIEAVGLMSLWFSFGSGSGVLARFVVEWESGKEGCTMHVSPDGLWPHTKFLEDFINGGEVASLLDCIRLTAGPLHALAAATRPARAAQSTMIPAISSMSAISKQSAFAPSQAVSPSSSIENPAMSSSSLGNLAASATPASALGSHGLHSAASMLAASARGGSGIVPSSLLPIDVSVVLRGPYWIRIIYRKNFAVDMRCFAGDQVWLQPATPPKGGPSVGGSLPCPQFRPFIMEHVAQELNGLEPNYSAGHPTAALANSSNPAPSSGPHVAVSNGVRANIPNSSGLPRPGGQVAGAIARMGNALSTASTFAAMNSMLPLRRSPVGGVPAHVRGELNTAIIGLGDDGGYGGGWVPLVALKKVLRGILKYLGVLWLFAQLPDLLKEILGSILKENEGALLNLDQEQPALRFFVGGYVFAVSVHRVQLLLQVLSVRRFNQQQQQQQNASSGQEELTQSEIGEICDYFSRRVASEPYDASRVASFITLLTLPISVLREFLKLITWKKSLAQSQLGDTVAPSQKPRIELCLENHSGLNIDGSSSTKSNVHYDRACNAVDFGLTVVLDSANIPHANVAGGAGWLPYCVLVRLRYSFGDTSSVTFLGMKGSHGGRACWFRASEWENCKQTVSQNLDGNGFSAGDVFSQGRLRVAADSIQKALHLCLQGLRDGHGGGVDTGGSEVGLS